MIYRPERQVRLLNIGKSVTRFWPQTRSSSKSSTKRLLGQVVVRKIILPTAVLQRKYCTLAFHFILLGLG